MKRKIKQPPCPGHPRFLLKRGKIQFWVVDGGGARGADSIDINKLTHSQREEAACIAACWFYRRAMNLCVEHIQAGLDIRDLHRNIECMKATENRNAWMDWLDERGGMCT